MVRHGGSSAGSYLADPTSPIPSHCASFVATSTVRVNQEIAFSQYAVYFLPDRFSVVYSTVYKDRLPVQCMPV